MAVRSVFYRIVIGLALASSALLPALESGADYVPPATPPAEFEALNNELSQRLTSFEAQLDAQWDGSVGQGRFGTGLAQANGNKSVGLLTATNWTRVIEMLDAFQAMGVGLVKIDLHYPLFTPAFHSYLAAHPPPQVPNYSYTVDNFVGYPNSFYNRVAAEIEARNMDLWVEHSTIFNDWSVTPPAGYFAEIRSLGLAAARERYMDERIAEMVLVASELSPAYYTLVDEPTTQNDNFGYFPGGIPILTPDGWRDLAQQGAAGVAAALPGYASLLGAGSGTWEGRGYTERFAALLELDYIDFHLYPLATAAQDYLENVLDWTDYVRGVDPTKAVTLGEAWLYKAGAAELGGGINANDVFGRDVYSFWEPLDRQFLALIFKIVHYKDFSAAMPYWTQYYFAYLSHGDPSLEGLSGIQLVARAGQEAVPNIQSVSLTGAGERLVELLSAANDADGDRVPDSADNSDSDGDFLADYVEHFCGSLAAAAGSRPERLDGPFANVDDNGDTEVDEALPAGVSAYDCDGDGYAGAVEDHVFSLAGGGKDQDACGINGWPADLAGGSFSANKINITDMSSFIAPPPRKFNTAPGDPTWDPAWVRWDLVPEIGGLGTKHINLLDLGSVNTLRPPMLAGARAFGGAPCPWPP